MGTLRWLVAGLGCRQGCPVGELNSLLLRALALIGADPTALQGIATLDRRLNESGLVALAKALKLPLVGYSAPALTPFQALLSHHSLISWHHTGCHGVAESAALAHSSALSGTRPRLAVTRMSTAGATIALATASST